MREIKTLAGRSLSTISRGESRIRVEYFFDGQAEIRAMTKASGRLGSNRASRSR